MAETYVALLRGINVGKAKRVAMADLRLALESLGYGHVRTLLNSGNAVFTSARPLAKTAAERMQVALEEHTGVSSRFLIRTASALEAVVKADPVGRVATDPSRYFVGFLYEPEVLARIRKIASPTWKPDVVIPGDGVVYLWCPNGLTGSRAFEAVGRELGDGITTRNWATVGKLLAMTRG